jgi:hypothetical protein
MQVTALHHTEMVRELATLRLAVSCTVELVLGRSPGETSRVEVENELVAKFQRLEELCSWLEGHGARICGLLVGPPASQDRWVDRLDKAAGRLEAKMAE